MGMAKISVCHQIKTGYEASFPRVRVWSFTTL